jgi:NAD(P)-dependent dehydrogenase (short-subunit alcohol dehydrogenase family)
MYENSTISKVALITGANKGIGRETAAQLAALGMTVLLGARDPRRGQQAAAALEVGGGTVRPLALDVTDPATIQGAAEDVQEHFGRLDVLVNNAGISGAPASLAPGDADLDALRQVFETNVAGVIAVTEALLPLLRRAPRARIVNVSSSVGSLARMTDPGHYFAQMPAQLAYPASKAALNMLTVQYAKDLRGAGILVNAADPGACATDFTRHIAPHLTRTAAEGAAVVVCLATLDDHGPTGGLFNQDGPVPW